MKTKIFELLSGLVKRHKVNICTTRECVNNSIQVTNIVEERAKKLNTMFNNDLRLVTGKLQSYF